MRKPLILGHRGYRGCFPENTWLGMKKALEAGADGIECDIQKCGSGEFVVLHDDTINRTSNGKGKVAELSLTDLRHFDFGNGETIMTLEALLHHFPTERFLNIELKEETLTPIDAEEIGNKILSIRNPKNTLVTSFEHQLLPSIQRLELPFGYLLDERHLREGLEPLCCRLLAERPAFVNPSIELLRTTDENAVANFLSQLRTAQIKIAFWTVNSSEELRQALPTADCLITDEVDLLLRLVG